MTLTVEAVIFWVFNAYSKCSRLHVVKTNQLTERFLNADSRKYAIDLGTIALKEVPHNVLHLVFK